MTSGGEVALLEGAEALTWLETPATKDQLDGLCRRCPWATPFQSWAFISAWYRCYQAGRTPILIHRWEGERLTGFFALAREQKSGRVTVAGDHQAEYQAWLAEPDDANRFLRAALKTLKSTIRPDQLTLRYLAPKAPGDWIDEPFIDDVIVTRKAHKRPLISLADPQSIQTSLKKKSNKSRLNRLNRIGEVALRHLETRAALEAWIDEIATAYDLRQGAANGVCPFTDDPLKRRFHLDLMDQPGLMQASILTVGDQVAATHLGLLDDDGVAVGVFGHAPAFGKHSPGKLLMLMLGLDLAAAGRRWIDLTPGGAWKDRFATDHDQVLEVTIFFAKSRARARQVTETALGAARSLLSLVGVTPDDARRFAQHLRQGAVLKRRRGTDDTPEERIIYSLRFDPETTRAADPGEVARNRSRDLLHVDPGGTGSSRQSLLAEAEQRLALGQKLYSRVEGSGSAHSVWLIEDEGPEPSSALPGKTAWIEGRAFDAPCILAIVHDLKGRVDQLAAAVAKHDRAKRLQLEAIGFTPFAPGD